MKTKLKRHSRAVLAVVLTLCMLVSCMTVGIIATDAAKTAEERVGAGEYTFASGSSIYLNATAYGSGVNFYLGTYTDDWYEYTSSIKERTCATALSYGSDSDMFKSNGTSWNMTKFSAPPNNENMVVISTDGAAWSWQKYYSSDNTYYYSGTIGNWSQRKMTLSADGSYEYFMVTTSSDNSFKIGTSSSQYAYDGDNIDPDSPITLTSDTANNKNIKTSQTGTYYIIVYPNGGTPLISASTTLPPTVTEYDVTINAGDHGSITTSPSTLTGLSGSQTITVTATPDTNYHVVWPDGFTPTANTNEATVTVSSAATYTVNFAEDEYTVSVSAGAGGSVNKDSITAKPITATNLSTITVTPDTGYHFAGWTSSGVTLTGNSPSDPTAGTIKATASGGTLQANFEKTDYTVTLNKNADDATAGTASVTATYGDAMPTSSVTMPTRTGYTFEGYYDTSDTSGGTQYYTAEGASARTWDKTSNTTLYARWSEITGGAVVRAYTDGSASSTGGTVKVGASGTASGTVNLSAIGITSANTVIATKKTHYNFSGWQFTGTNCTKLRYRFSESDEWSTPAANTTYGASNTTIYIKTNGDTGITTENAEVHALFTPITYENITIQGKYSEIGTSGSYTNDLTDSIDGADSGAASKAVSGTNQDGISIKANTVSGYTFVGWVCSGGTITDASLATTTFKPTDNNQTVTAQYKKNYTVTYADVTNGTKTETTVTVAAGGTSTCTFTPSTGYGLTSIKEGTTEKLAAMQTSAYNYTSSVITSDITVYATFTKTYIAKANLTRKHSDGSTNRFDSGNGSVQVTGGSSSTTSSTATLPTGTSVTFTATPNTGYAFVGWYSDAGCNTDNLVSKNASYTVTLEADTTLYAMFNRHTYYLTGKFYLADLCREVDATISNNTFSFTQDSTDPRKYTYENDFMFAYFTGDVNANHLQYVSVGWNGSSMYTTATENAASGDAASGTTSSTTDYKWMVGDNSASGAYPVTALNNCYKHVKFTWDSLDEELSWEISDINPEEYVTMYVNGERDGDDYVWDHLWLSDGTVLTGKEGALGGKNDITLTGVPYIVDNTVTYNVVLISNSTVKENTTAYAQLNTGGGSPSYGSNVGPMEEGHSYKIIASSSGAPQEYSPVKYAITIDTPDTTHGSAATTSPASTASMNTPITITTHPAESYIAVVTVTNTKTSQTIRTTRDDDEYSFTMPAAPVSISVDYEEIVPHNINIGVNNSSLGTASASVSSAAVDAPVTLTVTPSDEGMLTGITITGATSGDTITYSPAVTKDGGSYTFTMPNEAVNVAVTFDYYAGESDYYLDGWCDPRNADGDSEFSAVVTSRQLTTAKLGGIYSYTKVKSTDDFHGFKNDTTVSIFAVKTPSTATPASTAQKYMYVLGSDRFGKNDMYIGYTTDGTNYTEKSMTHVADDGTNKKWKYPVPSNITKFYLKTIVDGTTYYANNGNSNYSVTTGDKLEYHVYGWDSFTVTAWTSGYTDVIEAGESAADTGTYYKGDSAVYKDSSFNVNILPSVKEIKSYGIGGSTKGPMPYVDISTSEEYYVIVLHPSTTYRLIKNGETYTYTTGATPEIYASKFLPGEEAPLEPVGKVYAKDGAIRKDYMRFVDYADTYINKVTLADGTVVINSNDGEGEDEYDDIAQNHDRYTYDSSSANVYDYIEAIPYGATIEWKTTLGTGLYDGTNQFKNSHYVRGFSVNGVTEEVFDYDSSGEYTGKHVVTEADCRRGHIEITPIYWLKNSTYTKTFYIEGFDRDDPQFKANSWGDELGIYPYYSGKEGSANAFGGYPGQPMLFYKGTYMQQIPTTHNGLSTGAKVVGMTMSNNYWDMLHRNINKTDPIYPIAENQHRQTYDFDDFYEIANEKNPLTITFSYRYRTANPDNFNDGAETRDTLTDSLASDKRPTELSLSSYQDTSVHNGTEKYLDAVGRPIDLFGNVLTDEQKNLTPLLVITNGYKKTYVGKYATEWAVYKQKNGDTYEYVTSISPSALVANSSSKLSTYNASAYSTAYTTLEAYKGKPVLISFESAQTNTSGDVANRLDGRWYYTKTSDLVEANVKIQYDNNDGQGYVNDTFTSSTGDDRNLGVTTGARAYFTNYEPNDIYGDTTSGKTQLTAATQYFYLKAEESTNYQFVGWYQEQDGKYIPMEQDAGVTDTHTIIKKSETYYARFKKITSGNVTVKHVIENGTIGGTNYNGSGTPYLTALIKNTDGKTVASFPKSTGANFLHSKYIRSIYADYDIEVTIQTDPDTENNFQTYGLNLVNAEGSTRSDTETFFEPQAGQSIDRDGGNTTGAACTFKFKVGDLFNEGLTKQDIIGLEYVSRLTKTEYTFQYEINYTFPSRIWKDQTYKVEGTINNDRISTYINLADNKEKSTLKQSLIENLTPYESNYLQVINWNYAGATQTCTLVSGTTYKIVANVKASVTSDGTVHAEFKLPYEYDKNNQHFTATAHEFYDKAADYSDYDSYTQEQFKALYDANPGQPASVDKVGTIPFTDKAESTTTTFDGNDTGVGYDDTVASITLTSQESHVFNTDNEVHDDESSMKLVTAPDYIYYGSYSNNTGANVTYHTYKVPCYYFSYDVDSEGVPKGYQYGGKTFNDGIVANNLVKKYFSRWDVYVNGKIITSCYSKEFNLAAYEDIVVVPVFDSDSPNGNNTGAAQQGAKADITFLGTTRNQWNVEGVGVSQVTVTKGGQTYNITATDRLFTDFDVQFADGTNVFREINGAQNNNTKYELGIVIQQLDALDKAGDGYDTSASTYADKYKGTCKTDLGNIQKWINGGSKPSGTYVKSVIGTNYLDNSKNFYNNHDLLSNKNTTEYYYYFTKSRSLSDGSSNNYFEDCTKAYRAIAYIKISTDGGTTWTTTVSDSPAYFTIYDEAVRTKY